jgi:hypothetical protein
MLLFLSARKSNKNLPAGRQGTLCHAKYSNKFFVFSLKFPKTLKGNPAGNF